MTDDPPKPDITTIRFDAPKLTKGEADAAGDALARRQVAEAEAYQLLRELLPHVRDDGSDPHLTDLLAEIGEVVARRETANREFSDAVLGTRGARPGGAPTIT